MLSENFKDLTTPQLYNVSVLGPAQNTYKDFYQSTLKTIEFIIDMLDRHVICFINWILSLHGLAPGTLSLSINVLSRE